MATNFQNVAMRHTREDERQLDADVAEVLRTAAGRRLLMALIGKSGIYTRSRPDRLEYDAGRRDGGLEVMHIANRHAQAMVELAQQERNALMTRRNEELETAERLDEKERKSL